VILNECAVDDPTPESALRPQSARVRSKNGTKSSELTFKPYINPNSLALVEKKIDPKQDIVSRLYTK
jgi:hypothetical protein